MHALGIDVGSTNVKVVLVDDHAGVAATASRPLATRRSVDNAGRAAVGQDPDELWAAVVAAIRDTTAADPAAAADVSTIGVCSQYSSIVPVDAAGEALGPIKLYLDTRGADRCWEILGRHDEAFDTWVARHGIPPVGGGLSLGHLLHFQHDEPELHERTAAYLEVMDLVNLRLTGEVGATQCTAFATQLCDNRSVGTTVYDEELVAMSGVDPTRLAALIPIDGVHGRLTDGVARSVGLPAGIEVRAAMNDTQAGAFATGALAPDAPGRGGVVVGTTGVLIRAMDQHAVDLDHEILAMPVPVPGRFVVMAENGVAGAAVERALDLLSPTATDGARSTAADQRFAELEAALERTTAGAGGVLFLPWLAGSMSPATAPEMRGGYLGLALSTERVDVLRATVEGVARNLRWLLPAVDALAGSPTTELTFGGGGARSPGVARVLAEVCGRRVAVLERPELAAARAVGAVALARHTGRDPLTVTLPLAARIEPDPAAVEIHDRLQPVFEDAFSATRAICQALGS